MENIQIPITENGKTTLATAGKYCDRNVDINVTVENGISETDRNIPNNMASEGVFGWDVNCNCTVTEVQDSEETYLSIRAPDGYIAANSPLIPAQPGVSYSFTYSHRGNTFININLVARDAQGRLLEEVTYTCYPASTQWHYHNTDKGGNPLTFTPTKEKTAFIQVVVFVSQRDLAKKGRYFWADLKDMFLVSSDHQAVQIPTQVANNFRDGWVRGDTCSVTEVKKGESFIHLVSAERQGDKGWGARIFMPAQPGVEYTFTFTHKSSTFFNFAMQAYDAVDGRCLEEKDVRQVRSWYSDWVTSTFSFTPTNPATKYLLITFYRQIQHGWTMMRDMKLIARKGMPKRATVAYTGTMGRSATLYYTDENQQAKSVTFTDRVCGNVTVLKNSLLLLDGGLYPRYYEHGASGISVPCAAYDRVFLVTDDGYLYTQDDEVS